MTALLNPPTVALDPPVPTAPPSRLAGFGPNWFVSVMGTGIVANAAALLPLQIPGQRTFALVVWVLAALLLITLVLVSVAHVLRHPDVARGHHRNLAMAPFYGAPVMGTLTVGSGALLVGKQLIGTDAALAVDGTLWTLGTVAGLICAVTIPYLMFTLHRPRLEDTFGSWLMGVVPPTVSASAGAGLISHLPAGQARLSLELVLAACFGVSIVMTAALLPLLWARLALHGAGPAKMVPTLWIVLGPLGTSVTAAVLITHASRNRMLETAALVYGVPVWGFAMAWMALAAMITVRTARRHLPFSLTWWSFTFPVGVVVTGTSELAVATHAELFRWVAVALFVLLLGAWLTVGTRTVAGTISRSLFR